MAISSQRLSTDRITGIVRGVTPRTRAKRVFTSTHAGDRGPRTLIENMPSGHRWFEWRVARFPRRPEDRVSARVLVKMLLRIRYERDGDVAELERMVSEDVVDVVDALRKPTDWQMSTTGIRALVQNGEVEVENLPDDDHPHSTIVGIPFDLILEAC